MHSAQPPQRSKNLQGLANLLTKLPCSAIDAFHFWSPIAFHSKMWCTKGELEAEFLLSTCWCIWQRLEDLQPSSIVSDGFQVGRARYCPLPCLLPVLDGLFAQPCLRVVMRQQLGLGLGSLGKALGQRLRNALMVLLPRAP